VRRLAVLLLGAALLLPTGADAKPKPRKRTEVVCFKKTVWVKARTNGKRSAAAKRGRMVRKTVCRPRRKAAARPPKRFEPAVPTVDTTDAPAPAAVSTAPAAPQPATTAAATAAFVCADDSPWVGLTAEDVNGSFRWRITRTCVRAGAVLFDVRNNDLQQHDLWVRSSTSAPREIAAAIDPLTGTQGSATLTPGEWTLSCSILGHESMTRTLTVTPTG
jgi:hypothetical protein